MSTIGVLWLMLQVGAWAAIAVGVLSHPWLHWMDEPRWWLVMICVDLLWLGRFIGSRHWVLAGALALVLIGAFWYLRLTLDLRRKRAADRYGPSHWEPQL